MIDIEKDFVHLARFSLNGKTQDVIAIIRKSLREIVKRRPDLSEISEPLIRQSSAMVHGRAKSLFNEAMPVDNDSRLELIKKENIFELVNDLVLEESVQQSLNSVISERNRESELLSVGLTPTRSILLVGSPGVGKTLSAHWIAMKLNRPLLTLDLSAVMSSYLGKTGNNIRAVLEYAQKSPSVLLLDEFDAIAKRRDDITELGELKRLVTVLLQTVDNWPADGLLLAATNHPELLDPAIWRRFDRVIEFPKPGINELRVFVSKFLGKKESLTPDYINLISTLFKGLSYSEVENHLKTVLRNSVIENLDLKSSLGKHLSHIAKRKNTVERIQYAQMLESACFSQREISELSGLSRDTLRKNNIAAKNSRLTRKKGVDHE